MNNDTNDVSRKVPRAVESGDGCTVDPQGLSLLEIQRRSEFPISAVLCITESCSLSCPHCYLGDSNDLQELTLDEITELLDELASLGVFKLVLTGGDPTEHPALPSIVAHAWKRKFLIVLKTSGATLSLEHLEQMRRQGLSQLQVSLYHTDAAQHDRFVGVEGAWKNTVSCLERFQELGGICVVGMVVMNWNSDATIQMQTLCDEKKWSFIVECRVTHRHGGGAEPLNYRATDDQLQRTLHQVEGFTSAPSAHEAPDVVCGAGQSSVYFAANGDVWLCPSIPISLGNIRQKPFSEIWKTSAFRKKMMQTTWGDASQCMTCEHNRFCSRCPGESILEHGDHRLPATVDCQVAKAKASIFRDE